MAKDIDNEVDLACPFKMQADSIFVLVTDETKKKYEGEGMVRTVSVEFAWIGLSDKIRLNSEKSTHEELDKLRDRFQKYHGKECQVIFKVGARRDGDYRNRYSIIDVLKIKEVGGSSIEGTSASRLGSAA